MFGIIAIFLSGAIVAVELDCYTGIHFIYFGDSCVEKDSIMNYLQWWLLLFLLILLSAFFSGSETGMMAINRYRLRHRVRHQDVKALRVMRLLEQPDRLLGLILLGNTFANILATSIATMLAVAYFGKIGILLATLILTPLVLIFAETMPKTLAAVYPEQVAYRAAVWLRGLLWLFYPIVLVINSMANGLLRLFGLNLDTNKVDNLSSEELESVVNMSSDGLAKTPRQLMLRALSFNDVVVEDVMIPRQNIYGIDIRWPWPKILNILCECKHVYLPIFDEHIDQVKAMVNVPKALSMALRLQLDLNALLGIAEDIYFIPEGTSIDRQLVSFQQRRAYVGLVVDEYGDITGFLSIKDILEELVGEYDDQHNQEDFLVQLLPDGSVLIDAAIPLRDLCRQFDWKFPVDGPNTLGGLCIEYLQFIPKSLMCLRIEGYPIEIMSIEDNMIIQVKVWPNLFRPLD